MAVGDVIPMNRVADLRGATSEDSLFVVTDDGTFRCEETAQGLLLVEQITGEKT